MLSISTDVFHIQQAYLQGKMNTEYEPEYSGYIFPLRPEELGMLEELINQDQFEIADEDVLRECTSEKQSERCRKDVRIVFLMNDAAESFLVLKNCRVTGIYQVDYEGEIQAEVGLAGKQYILVLHQGPNIVSFFFDDLQKEIHLYNYARLGHFWVQGYEYLRQLEYHLAILRDKRDYLGEDYCNETELELAALTEFPPLNYCCYPAAPLQYVVPAYPEWQVSKAALNEMQSLAAEAGDASVRRWLWLYEKWPSKIMARRIAEKFHQEKHAALTDLIIRKMEEASAVYPDRRFDGLNPDEDSREKELIRKQKINPAWQCAWNRKQELERSGLRVDLVCEEPFTTSRDSIELKYHLMIWGRKKGNRITRVETFE